MRFKKAAKMCWKIGGEKGVNATRRDAKGRVLGGASGAEPKEPRGRAESNLAVALHGTSLYRGKRRRSTGCKPRTQKKPTTSLSKTWTVSCWRSMKAVKPDF